ncbi:hypothetical protein PISL3812_00174 [Talaromyces islandicus]|uniref:Uncharacterized protein n=1 Tax=Talaromyces islandicus TaxID=28573 RepID=A0A0U1LIH9_TALIS|nr:hypothetical protein PISL3812_00174 [Talaromyces islandicus]
MSEKAQNLYTREEDPETAPPAYEPYEHHPSSGFSNNNNNNYHPSSSSRAENATTSTSTPTEKPQPAAADADSSYRQIPASSYSQPTFLPPAPAVASTTKKPIAIPAINPYSSHSPFVRAFPPILRQSHNLPRESFLPFLDNLNKLIAESPPLEVLDVTGGILRSVPILFPLHWIGATISGLAQKGSSGVAKSRTDSLIKQANKDIFGPRGLRIEIARLDALAHIARVPILNFESGGRIDNWAPVMRQLVAVDPVVNNTSYQAASEGKIPEEVLLDSVQQQVGVLQPWIAELEFDQLPRTAQSKLTRFNAALKRYNNDPRGEGRERDVRGKAPEAPEDGVRKGLWLVIRELE